MADKDISRLAEEVRKVYRLFPDRERQKEAIRDLLNGVAGGRREEVLRLLQDLKGQFAKGREGALTGFIEGVLGGWGGETTEGAVERLKAAFNELFDALNDLVRVVRETLLGKEAQEQTIRAVIRERVGGEGADFRALRDYVFQLKEAFSVAYEAFQKAAEEKVGEILQELDPQRIAEEGGGFGPLKKAHLYEVFEDRFHRIKQWYDSGRFLQDFLRSFEKFCQKGLL